MCTGGISVVVGGMWIRSWWDPAEYSLNFDPRWMNFSIPGWDLHTDGWKFQPHWVSFHLAWVGLQCGLSVCVESMRDLR